METEVWKRLAPLRPGLRERWRDVVGEVPGERALTLGEIDRLRTAEGPVVARFVSLQLELARRARGRLGGERTMFLTSKGAEQATAWPVARHRAARLVEAADDATVWDACTGIGSDLVALGRALAARRRPGDRIVASDRSPEALRCALANLTLALEEDGADLLATAVAAVADAGRPLLADPAATVAVFDPDRRPEGVQREQRAARWSPPIEQVLERSHELAGACIKLPPATTRESLEVAGLSEDAECAWVSLDGDMKELSVWTGRLATTPTRRAVALRSSGREACFSAARAPAPEPAQWPARWSSEDAAPPPSDWLVELDPTLWAADLAGAFATERGLRPLPGVPRGGFLIAREPVVHGLARCYRILAISPADRRRVRAMLRAHGIGPVTVKTRGHPVPADRLAASFRGTGDRAGLVAVTRTGAGTVAMLLEAATERRDHGDGRVVGDEGLEPPTPSL